MTIYKSKIDLWLWIPVLLGMMLCIWSALFVEFDWIIFLSGFLPIIFCVDLIFCRTYYSIDAQTRKLRVKCGFITDFTINIDKITSIRDTRSWLSAPAASLDRIEVKYGKCQSVVISPKEKQKFIAELLNLNPGIAT